MGTGKFMENVDREKNIHGFQKDFLLTHFLILLLHKLPEAPSHHVKNATPCVSHRADLCSVLSRFSCREEHELPKVTAAELLLSRPTSEPPVCASRAGRVCGHLSWRPFYNSAKSFPLDCPMYSLLQPLQPSRVCLCGIFCSTYLCLGSVESCFLSILTIIDFQLKCLIK